MITTQTGGPVRQANGKLAMAIARLADRYPFQVAVLHLMKITPRPEVGTMAVTVSGDEILLLHDPSFVLAATLDELGGVALHIVHHLLFNHVLADPADFPDEWARTVAEEITANEFIDGPLPKCAILRKQFPRLIPAESTDQRYRRLKREKKRPPFSTPRKPHGAESIDGPPGAAGHVKQKPPTATPSRASGVCEDAERAPRDPGRNSSRSTLDDHTVWKEARKEMERSRAAVKAAVEDAILEAGHGKIPAYLKDALGQVGIGTSPGEDQYDLAGGQQGHLDWRHLLRRYVGQVLETRPVFTRPPRRFPELVGVVPARGRQAERPKIMAVIDTSASITPEMLEMIDAELARLARHHQVTVVECDMVIHAVFPYRPLKAVTGRGGTDLRPPFEEPFLREQRPDLVLFFTDGYGPAPPRGPRMPVIWCLLPGGQKPVEWGRSIEM